MEECARGTKASNNMAFPLSHVKRATYQSDTDIRQHDRRRGMDTDVTLPNRTICRRPLSEKTTRTDGR
jgi:hypothetical protein